MKNLKCSVSGADFFVSDREEALLKEFQLPLPDKAAIENWLYAVGQSTPFLFHKIICPVTKKPILSRWSDKGAIIAVSPEWFWSDECDNISAGQDYDFNRPFFEQFLEVARKSYAASITQVQCENSPYVNACIHLKDCHLCFACEHLRECLCCALCSKSTDLLYCSGVSNSELCYSCLNCNQIYGSRFLQDCQNCTDCFWCLDCIGCKNCFQCVGLRQAQDGYYIRNEKVSLEHWTEVVKSVDFGSYQQELKINMEAENYFFGKKDYNTNFHNENCSEIYHVKNSKNSVNALYSQNCVDCKDIIFSTSAKDCYCAIWVRNAEKCYYTLGSVDCYNCTFCDGASNNARNLTYCFCCFNGGQNLFGCFFLKRKEFCILNKQYSKEEYFELLPRVIEHMKSTGEWGKWFPTELYEVSYEDSWANFFLIELTPEQIKKRGLISSPFKEDKTINFKTDLPDKIKDFSEKFCDQELKCQESCRPYRISKQELKTFQKHNAPIPRKHWSLLLIEMQHKSTDPCKQKLKSQFAAFNPN